MDVTGRYMDVTGRYMDVPGTTWTLQDVTGALSRTLQGNRQNLKMARPAGLLHSEEKARAQQMACPAGLPHIKGKAGTLKMAYLAGYYTARKNIQSPENSAPSRATTQLEEKLGP